MLKIALAEEGIDPAECEINIDHNLGDRKNFTKTQI